MVEKHGRRTAVGALLLLVVAVIACTTEGRFPNNPLSRNLQWFSYVGGDDIRSGCVAGASPRYRFIYNAVWDEQVRTYDLTRGAPGTGATLEIHVVRDGTNVLQTGLFGSTATLGTTRVVSRIDEQAYLRLVRAVEASGFGAPARQNHRLPGWDFYWLVNACAEGRWHLNAWRRRDDGFNTLAFVQELFALDRSGIAINLPREVSEADRFARYNESPRDRGRAMDSFEILIRDGRVSRTPWPF
jgi:hypothetical protein